jgi:hypothetical protein
MQSFFLKNFFASPALAGFPRLWPSLRFQNPLYSRKYFGLTSPIEKVPVCPASVVALLRAFHQRARRAAWHWVKSPLGGGMKTVPGS